MRPTNWLMDTCRRHEQFPACRHNRITGASFPVPDNALQTFFKPCGKGYPVEQAVFFRSALNFDRGAANNHCTIIFYIDILLQADTWDFG